MKRILVTMMIFLALGFSAKALKQSNLLKAQENLNQLLLNLK